MLELGGQTQDGILAAPSVKPEQHELEKPVVISRRTGKPKRRKAMRACIHCQRSHLTCDDNRPCERCVARGLEETCRDSVRKRAKYLRADGENPSSVKEPLLVETEPLPHASVPPREVNTAVYGNFLNGQQFFGHHRFQSQATDSEYNVLGHLVKPERAESSPSHSDDSNFHYSLDGNLVPGYQSHINNYNVKDLENQSLMDILAQQPAQDPANFDWLQPPKPPPMSLTINEQPVLDFDYVESELEADSESRLSSTAVLAIARSQQRKPGDIYRNVNAPFPYTPGFHALIRYLKDRFPRTSLMRIIRYMASYRPSFIAITNSLTRDDLVFMEQCFQRTLLDYEKYFTYCGTPTIIWRRTGQIAAVGNEFCVLSGWSMDSLVNQKDSTGRFILELLDNDSVIRYFEIFSQIFFNDLQGQVMSSCTLVNPQGQKVRTSSVLTIRRDLFGIPMMVVGNFLPILS